MRTMRKVTSLKTYRKRKMSKEDSPSELVYRRAKEYEKLLDKAKEVEHITKTHQPHYSESVQ